MNQKDNWL